MNREITTKRPTVSAAEEIIGGYFPVLDHGFVSLVDYMGSDEAIDNAARVSYGDGTRQVNPTRGLIRYLRRHSHTTPSEMVEFKFHCCMPIFVARQWIRHRTASVNEISARYSLLPLLFYEPNYEQFAYQSSMNKQGREQGTPVPPDIYSAAVERWERIRSETSDTYRWLASEDIARELARIDLPLSTYTQWYWKIDLHNLLHFLRLRVDAHAQWEIREYGRVMAGMLQKVTPLSYDAWIDYEIMGTSMSTAELNVLSSILRVDVESNQLHGIGDATYDNMIESGLTIREIQEFMAKLTPKERPDYTLDMSRMLSAGEMARRTA